MTRCVLAHSRRTSLDVSRPALLASALFLVSASVASAQTQFAEVPPKRYLPAVPDVTADVVIADYDGDGDPDALTANGYATARLYLNDGAGIFTDASATSVPVLPFVHYQRIGTGDVDGDGDVDALLTVGLIGASNPLFLVNDGSGVFADEADARLPAGSLREGNRASFGDVDGDGDLDLVCPHRIFPVGMLLNDGAGFFTDASASRMPAVNNLNRESALADVDGDGDLDLVLTNVDQDRLYLNDGFGFFDDATASHMPVQADYAEDVALVDVDLDLDPDLVFANAGSTGSTLLLNDGAGFFSDASANLTTARPVHSVVAGDVDGDLDPDLVVGGGIDARLYLNDGSGVFEEAPFPPPGLEEELVGGLALSDFDADGDLDLYMARSGLVSQIPPAIDRLYLNDATGGFTNVSPERIEWSQVNVSAVELADLDRDGDLDLVTADGEFMGNISSTGYGEVRPYFNDGRGRFPSGKTLYTTNAIALAVGDVDGDAWSDILVGSATLCYLGYGCFPTSNELYFNDRNGGFVELPGRLPTDSDDTFAVALADVDGDADLDAVFGNGPQPDRLYANSGSGEFVLTAGRLPITLDQTRALAVGDFDADDDLEIVTGNESAQNRMYVNEGGGTFFDATAARMPAFVRKTRALGIGDVDRDGDLDLVLGNDGRPGLYLNNGAGKLVDYTDRMPSQTDHTWALRVGDVDEDGDLDVALGNRSATGLQAANRLLLNDGTARFANSSRLPTDLGRTAGLALGDIDCDRDLDLLVGNLEPSTVAFEESNRVYLNLHRQLEARLEPLAGRTYEIELHSRPGYGTSPRTAVVAFSFGLLATPISSPPLVGKLRLQSPLLFLPAVSIPAPAGKRVISLAVPTDPTLFGTTFYAQAVIVDQGLQLTGIVRDTFGR